MPADCVIRLNFSVNERQVCDRSVWVSVCSVWAVTTFILVVITAVSEEHAASIFSAFVHGANRQNWPSIHALSDKIILAYLKTSGQEHSVSITK